MDIEKITPKQVEKEISEWVAYLNEMVGAVCFTLGLASLGTPNPPFYAFLSMIFVGLIHFPNYGKKAATLTYLSRKTDLTDHEAFILNELRGKITVVKSAVAWFGYIFLFLIATLWAMGNEHPKMYKFLYGDIAFPLLP